MQFTLALSPLCSKRDRSEFQNSSPKPMQFSSDLIPGTLERRYKRFLADVTLPSGETITAHCANPGAMMGLNEPGSRVWLSKSKSKTRKLPYSWELIEAEGALVGINTAHPNRLAEEAVLAGKIAELDGYEELRREVKYGQNSRIDLLLQDTKSDRPECYVEVKNVHLKRRAGLAEFPDSVTERGRKHLRELMDMVAAGNRAVMLYIVQRTDCESFEIANDIDPKYAEAFTTAVNSGVEVLCYGCRISTQAIEIDRPLNVRLL